MKNAENWSLGRKEGTALLRGYVNGPWRRWNLSGTVLMRRSLPKIETGGKKKIPSRQGLYAQRLGMGRKIERWEKRGVFAEVDQGCQREGGVAEMLRCLRTVLSFILGAVRL